MPKDSRITKTPPYVAYASFKNFINGLGETSVPSRIDKTVMSNFSGSTQYALLPALQWLGLTDLQGNPSSVLKKLAAANEADFGQHLAPIVKEKYGFLFCDGLDLKTASSGQVEDAFKNQEIKGSTVTKCITFFLRIAKDAKIPVSPHVKAPTTKRAPTGSRRRTSDPRNKVPAKPEEEPNVPPQEMEIFTIPIRGLADGRLSLPKDLDEIGASKALRIIKFNLEQYYDIKIDD